MNRIGGHFTTVILLFEGATQLDATGPTQGLARLPGGRVVTAAKTREAIATEAGFALAATHGLDDAPTCRCGPASRRRWWTRPFSPLRAGRPPGPGVRWLCAPAA